MDPEKITRHLARVSISVLAFCAVISLATAWMIVEFPVALSHALDGSETVREPSAPNYIRNPLELLNFLSTSILVPGVALWAIYFARKQADEARNSREEAERVRLSTIYMNIVEKWNSDEIVAARAQLFSLVDEYRKFDDEYKAAFGSESGYVCTRLLGIRATDRIKHRSYTILLQFFEDLGLLCWKKYIKQDDIFDFIGSSIVTQMGYLELYIRAVREEKQGHPVRSRYANAIYLYNEAHKFARSGSMHEEDF
jgi:hypothetical protein